MPGWPVWMSNSMCPAYDAELSSRDVLVMDFVRGKLVTDPSVAALSQKRRDQLGRAMLELFFFEVFDLGLMQADPNFGNYLIGDIAAVALRSSTFGSVGARVCVTPSSALADTIAGGAAKGLGQTRAWINEARLY